MIVKSRRVGEDNAHSKVVEKYSKMIDVYKKENQTLRFRLEAAETELTLHTATEEMFTTKTASEETLAELKSVKSKLG